MMRDFTSMKNKYNTAVQDIEIADFQAKSEREVAEREIQDYRKKLNEVQKDLDRAKSESAEMRNEAIVLR